MLKHRIIPVLLWDGKQAVQTVQFGRPYRPVGSMMQHIRVMETRNIDELIILDICATAEKRKPLFNEIKEFTKELFCPVTIGGGITELDDVKRLIQDCGADKISINKATTFNPGFINEIANKFGSQSIVFSMDAIGPPYSINSMPLPLGIAANVAQSLGAGELLLTSVMRNGTKKGYDISPIYSLIHNAKITIPIIINGGCGHPSHMAKAIHAGASAVAASSLFLFTEWTPRACAKALHEAKIPVRIEA